MGECVGKGMQEVRQRVYEDFLKRLDGLRREGVNGSWLWCLTRLWGVEKGEQVRWGELSWEGYYEKMVEMGEAEVNQEGEVVWGSGRARMLAELCGMKPTDLRWWGMVDHRWEGWMHKVGMTRRQARAVMGLVVWVGQAYITAGSCGRGGVRLRWRRGGVRGWRGGG